MISLIPSTYHGPDRPGDFAWMIRQPEHRDSLFVYNENVETHESRDWSQPGGGNAAIRPYRDQERAIGIPTGSRSQGGFVRLTDYNCDLIDEALGELYGWLVDSPPRFARVIYSADNGGRLLGCGIFDVGLEVRQYITDGLCHIVEVANRYWDNYEPPDDHNAYAAGFANNH